MRTRWVVLTTATAATAMALVAPGAGGAATGAERTPGRAFDVTGFAVAGQTPLQIVEEEAPALDRVSVAGITVKRSGAEVTLPAGDTLSLLDRADNQGLRTELLISNYDNRLGDFRPETAANLLRSAANRQAVAQQIGQIMRANDWADVNIDLERLRASDAPGLVAFVRAVRQQVAPPHRGGIPIPQVSVDVGARTTLADYRAAGFNLGPLGEAADRLVLMAYDLHGPSWSGPGPIGPLPWVRKTLNVMQTQVTSEKIDLGIAGYGYTWPRNGTGKVISPARARQLVENNGVDAVWHRTAAEYSARLPNGTVLWWSDHRSYQRRYDLAYDVEILHGVALWRLGLADRLVL